MRLRAWAAGAAMAVGMWAGSAQARLVSVVYAGTIESGYDISGVFGEEGADLSGTRFQIKYIVDTIGGNIVNSASGTIVTGNGLSSPIAGSCVYINTTGLCFSVGKFSKVSTFNSPTFSEIFYGGKLDYENGIYSGEYYIESRSSRNDGIFPASLEGPVDIDLGPETLGYSAFKVGLYKNGTPIGPVAYAMMRNEHVTIGLITGIPEPSTWAMMLIGFAGLSFVARRRHGWRPIR